MPQRVDLFAGDQQGATLQRGPTENLSFGGRVVRGSRLYGRIQPGRRMVVPSVPTGNGYTVAWSPSGRSFLVGCSVAPYVMPYIFDGTNFIAQGGLTFGPGFGVSAWSSRDFIMFSDNSTSPYFSVAYFRYPDQYTFLAVPTPPAGPVYSASWSPDGLHLALGHIGGSYISVYRLNYNEASPGTSTLSLLTAPSTLPSGPGYAVCWSPDGRHLAVSHDDSPSYTNCMKIYRFNGSVLTAITNPVGALTLPTQGLSWSPDGRTLAISMVGSPYVKAFRFEDGVFTSPGDNPTFNGATVAAQSTYLDWSKDGRFLAVGYNLSPYLAVYTYDGKNFVDMRTPETSVIPAGALTSLMWSPDSKVLSAAHFGGVRISCYESLPGSLVGGPTIELEPPSNVR